MRISRIHVLSIRTCFVLALGVGFFWAGGYSHEVLSIGVRLGFVLKVV